MLDTIERIDQFANKHHMFDKVENIVAGVSGGADSMCMLHILYLLQEKYGYKLTVVHIHHGIRGIEADEDMEYVENYCKINGISYQGFRFQVEKMAKEDHLSSEEAGRMVRYETFHKVLEEVGGGKIAVAHNSDDNSETFLLNLFRGSGIKGLSGIQPVRDGIIRPVLCLKRSEILEYLRENGIDYKTDKTNEGDLYTRNKIRNKILPYIRTDINERASEHIAQAADALNEINEYMEKQAELQYGECVTMSESMYTISIAKFENVDRVIKKMILRKVIYNLSEKLKDITARHVDAMLGISLGETGKQTNIAYGIVCRKNYENLEIFKREKEEMNGEKKIEDVHMTISTEVFVKGTEITIPIRGDESLIMEKTDIKLKKIREKMYTKWLDYDILRGTIQLRNRKAGDYITVNAHGGRKKLKDYFMDLKIPREDRDKVLLLARGNEVFWVIGYRISERCKITENTKQILRVEYRDGKTEE